LGIGLVILALATGAWAEGFPEYRPAALRHTQTVDDFTLALEPLVDEDELDRYFGTDLVEDGILPIFVSLRNSSPTRSFIVLKANVGVALAPAVTDSDVASPIPGSWVSTAGLAAAVFVTPVAGVVLLPIGVNMVSNAYEVKRNFVIKELQSHTLSPGTQASGFVYLKAEEGKSLPQDLWLRVEALAPRGGEPTRLQVPFSWTR